MKTHHKQKEYATPDELECFSSLLLRWPYDTPRKLFINLSNYGLYLYELVEHLVDTDDNSIFRLKAHTNNEDMFEYFLNNYEYLFFLKDEIISTEDRLKTITLRPAHIDYGNDSITCTNSNIGIVAAKSLNAICAQCGYRINYNEEKYDLSRINDVLQFGTRNTIIPEEKLWPKTPPTQMHTHHHLKRKEAHELALEYISLLRSLGQKNKHILAQEAKQRYPEVTSGSLGRIFSPYPGKKESPETLRRRGRRLLGKK